ncbi:hypothetical protein Taro_012752 [Colocasia esculenta]|uniref:DYW domain-containing protein n=1 Tax=Colocasia esculenta TaxID=4460 RepID=A0A843UA22_COLES|nr:hypothetical protein [Colocasia esculenta]
MIPWRGASALRLLRTAAAPCPLVLEPAAQRLLPPSVEETLAHLKALTDSRDLNAGRAIHARLVRSLRLDVLPVNTLINLYSKCCRTDLARYLFDGLPAKNVVSYSALMAGYRDAGLPSEALEVFWRMEDCGRSPVSPNEFVFTTALACCSDLKVLRVGEQCHARVLKSGLGPFPYVQNALLCMYLTCSGVEDASGFFYDEASFDVYSCNSMINGFLEHGHLGEALDVLGYILKDVEAWDHVTYLAVLGLSAGLKDSNLGSQIHGQVVRRGMNMNIFVGNCIVDMYGKCGEISSAQSAFRELPLRNVVSWTAIMAACTQNGLFEEALGLCSEMDASGVRPNEYTYAIMLNSCASLSALRHGDALNAHAEKSGLRQHLIVQNALINMYVRSGCIWEARRLFDAMLLRDIVSWNSMISGYSHHGLGREALEVFHYMLMEGVQPTPVTFVGVLSACGHLGLVDDGFYYLNHMMKEMGISPTVEHYTCLVGLLCRVGRLEEANSFMRTTDTRWDVIAWRTFLSACHVHKKYSLGKQVAEHILEFYPDDVGTYVLLSNMHAKTKRWDGVAEIRRLMRGRHIKKEPGISWIQVKGETHVFISYDKKHPKMDQIYAKLKDLLAQIRVMGYVPDIDNVLHDVEDEQKEECVSYHSEKLAVTFGIISMPSAAPIHVIKNLRICDDCHTAIKLIAFVAARKIVVRDANRFHCFENGKCSCGDYW